MAELVLVNPIVEGVVEVTVNRQDKKNALSIALRDALSDTLEQLARDAGVSVAILTGAGNTFSAGFDLGEFQQLSQGGSAEFAEALWASSDRFHRTVLEFPLPLLAAVNGPAIGGGFDLAVMCDLRVASDTAWFQHPEIEFIEVVYTPLHDLLGAAVAKELCWTGRRVDAAEALSLHLVSAVVPPDELAGRAHQLAAEIARAPRDVLLRMKEKAISRAGYLGPDGPEL
ncbi:MAG: Short-chain-enoyl-CoA hydratase [Acidimicrobiales bacterium]|nr:MAG: enoyl-CoA hydratase/isomerase family protein [Actinomycetota bacterium]MBV6507225.1 Short-chain-enoyl-CoA hydratase [Acidimicrobiales bacterium]RIK05491.1 MAG: enoyl-CoA hydratase/isomerase family protein [Acidobacteriota bacterium]